MTEVVYGVQPVFEALRAGRVERVLVARGAGGKTKRLKDAARREGVIVNEVPRADVAKHAGSSGHQGVVAILNGPDGEGPQHVDDLVDLAEAAGEDPLIVLLDGIQDPQNLGAIIRSAFALGAHGVVIPDKRAASITPAVVRASAGAALHIPVVTVTNIKHALDDLQKRGVWSAAAVMGGEDASKARLDGPIALVIGGEEGGVRISLAQQCDHPVCIPMIEDFDSLNASVAAGILLYEIGRQRRVRVVDK